MMPNNRMAPVPVDTPPAPLYHGTPAVLAPGDVVVAGRRAGTSRGHFVWLDTSIETAAMWGTSTNRVLPVHVYEVEPVGPVETCRSSFRSRSARVITEVQR